MLPRAGRHHDAARAQEQQALEHRVVQDVDEAGRDRQRRQLRAARAASAIIPAPRPSTMMPAFSIVL